MVWVEALIPFEKGELLSTIHQVGMVERTVSTERMVIPHFLFPLFFFFCHDALSNKLLIT